MKNLIFTLLIVLLTCLSLKSQKSEGQKSIAVALPNIENIDVSREVVAKLTQIELIKIDRYKVYDEFDMQEAMQSNELFQNNCYGKRCLAALGKEINADYILSTSLLSYGKRIIITMKIMDIQSQQVINTHVMEFVDQKDEMQRMLRIMVRQMHGIEVHPETLAKIAHDDRPIVKSNIYQIDNTGPRVGYSLFYGDLKEFATRPRNQGGLDIFPGATLIGYQFEKQYVGTENFSALGEVLAIVSGLEQGVAIPSVILMHGVRFGKAGWEIAFGPGFGVSTVSNGFFDTEGHYGNAGVYWTESEFKRSEFYDPLVENSLLYEIDEYLDRRGTTFRLNTRFVFAAGRTFRKGSLNLPVNVFYSNMRNSSMIGLSIGFNVLKD